MDETLARAHDSGPVADDGDQYVRDDVDTTWVEARTVFEVATAEFEPESTDPPPAGSDDPCPGARDGWPILHPSIPLRFADVIRELSAIAELAESGRVGGAEVVTACRRAGSLFQVLRRQFLDDVIVLEHPAPAADRG